MADPQAPGPAARPSVGLLYPGHSAEDDFPALEERLGGGVRLPLVHTSVGEDAHRIDALLDLGSDVRLHDGARALVTEGPDAIMWACTSGSFVFGWDGAHDQVRGIAEAAGLPASSTSLAFVNAARALRLRSVAVAASYPEDVAARFREFLGRGGIEVTTMVSNDIVTAAEVGTLEKDAVRALVAAVSGDGAEAVLVPDTAMHSLAWLDELEAAAGKPVLTANQVTVWEGLRLLGPVPELPGTGSLFQGGAR
ncbi:aspartate/glutamate racemase family protein [Salinifilum aidingensis]